MALAIGNPQGTIAPDALEPSRGDKQAIAVEKFLTRAFCMAPKSSTSGQARVEIATAATS